MSKTAGPRTETRRVLFEGVELTAGVLDDQSRGWPGCDVWSVASGRLIARCQSAETSLAPRLCASDVRLDGSLLPDARCLSLIHRRLHEAKTSSAIWDADFAMVLAFTASEMASEKAFATELTMADSSSSVRRPSPQDVIDLVRAEPTGVMLFACLAVSCCRSLVARWTSPEISFVTPS